MTQTATMPESATAEAAETAATASTAQATEAAEARPREAIRLSYFPGCSAESTGSALTRSTMYIASKIGMELVEIDDWCCCGTSAAKITSDSLMHAMPARSLALSERQNPGLPVVATCTGCYAALKGAMHYARQSEENRLEVSELIDMDYEASADVKSLTEVMIEPEVSSRIVAAAQKTLGGMKLACYYGCAQVRPKEVAQFGDEENPHGLEELMDACGAECVEWAFKTECCGASNHVVSPKVARSAVERIFCNAQANGAEAIITSCPLCWLNLDLREKQINSEMGTDYHMPVYYFTELIALALGASLDESGVKTHFEPAVSYVEGKLAELEAPQSEGAGDDAAPDATPGEGAAAPDATQTAPDATPGESGKEAADE